MSADVDDIQKNSSSSGTGPPESMTQFIVHTYWYLPSCCCDECRGMCFAQEMNVRLGSRSWIYWSFGPGKKKLKPLLENVLTTWLKNTSKEDQEFLKF
jgi:hypothetical protein